MNEKISAFLSSLKDNLSGMPAEEIEKAAGFYEEYLYEALESGKDIDEEICKLDPPGVIADKIRMETSVNRAQKNPGIRNFSKVFRNAFKAVTAPFAVFLLSIVALISYSMVALLFSGALASALGALASGLAFVYEGIRVPSGFFLDRLGTFGAGFMAAGLCMLLAVGLYKSGMIFIMLSTKLVRTMTGKHGKPVPKVSEDKGKSGIRPGRMVTALLVMTVAGTAFFVVSGLPWKYFVITNSMEPEGMVTAETFQYETKDVKKISVETTNTIIRLSRGTSDKISVNYQKADWLECTIDNASGTLTFKERSNGRLPLYELLSLHEGMTELEILLPSGYSPDSITLESRGGHIFITDPAGNIEARTFNGTIECSLGSALKDYSLKALANDGEIYVNGSQVPKKNEKATEYTAGSKSGKIISVTSTNGNISIK